MATYIFYVYLLHHTHVSSVSNNISLDVVKYSVNNKEIRKRDSDMVTTLNKEHWKSEERNVNNNLCFQISQE